MAFCLKAGDVAAQATVNVQTLRYYERLRLLDAPQRSTGNHRLYTSETIQRVLFIKRAQALGLSLAEIRGILQAEREGARRCNAVVHLLRIHLDLLAESLRDLEARRRMIEEAIEAWDGERVSGYGACRGTFCHLIERCFEPSTSPRSRVGDT
jgi:DNA-binding transcriptional MerR regulator